MSHWIPAFAGMTAIDQTFRGPKLGLAHVLAPQAVSKTLLNVPRKRVRQAVGPDPEACTLAHRDARVVQARLRAGELSDSAER